MNKPPKAKLPFFHTQLGRKVVVFAAGATSIGLFLGNFVPHTLGINFYKDFVQCYQNGVARPVSERVLNRLKDALDKLELRPYERKLIKPFTVVGFDIFQAGSINYRFGAILGIPINYNYQNINEMKLNEVRFRTNAIDWNSESGKILKEALILKEDEQIFGLCKSILQLQTHQVLMNSIFPSLSFLTVYTVGSYLNQKYLLLARPFSLRIVLYGILGLFGLGSWSFMKDFNQVSYDADIDKKLSSLGPEFIDAGVRYYDKVLKKNIALRALLGDDTYTAKGNENYFLRQKSLPLTFRKSFFDEKWKELQQGTETANELSQ